METAHFSDDGIYFRSGRELISSSAHVMQLDVFTYKSINCI